MVDLTSTWVRYHHTAGIIGLAYAQVILQTLADMEVDFVAFQDKDFISFFVGVGRKLR